MVEQGDLCLREHASYALATAFENGMANKQAPDEKQARKERNETIEGATAVISTEFEKLINGEVDIAVAKEVIKAKRGEIEALKTEVATLTEEIAVKEKPHKDKATTYKKVDKYYFNEGVELLGIKRATSVKKTDIKKADEALAKRKAQKKNGKKSE